MQNLFRRFTLMIDYMKTESYKNATDNHLT